jgi:hypothetical protein
MGVARAITPAVVGLDLDDPGAQHGAIGQSSAELPTQQVAGDLDRGSEVESER